MDIEVPVFDAEGNAIDKLSLSEIFGERVREEIIKRAVLSDLSKELQPKSPDPHAGLKTSARYRGRKETYGAIKNRGISRLPREILPDGRFGRVRRVPFSKGGHRAHPPKVNKILIERINKKEYAKALKSALSASVDIERVKKRGHKIPGNLKLPIVLDDSVLNSVSKTRQAVKLLSKLGLEQDLERAKKGKKIKTGVQRRVNLTKYPLSALVIVPNKSQTKAFENIPGVETTTPEKLSVAQLAPGTHPGRLLIIVKSAVSELEARLK